MTTSELEALFNSAYFRGDFEFIFKKAEKESDFFNLVWQVSLEKPHDQSWRWLWILDHATEKNNDFILPILDELYERVLTTNNESFIRQAMKLILRCGLKDEYIAPMLERCVVWMNDPKGKISSQVMGLEFFYQSCLLYPEMSVELLAYIDDILERKPSPGMRGRLLKIREHLDQNL